MTKEEFRRARVALDSMDDYARMETGVDPYGPRTVLEAFIREAEAESNAQYLRGYRDAIETLRAKLDRISQPTTHSSTHSINGTPKYQRECPVNFGQLRLDL